MPLATKDGGAACWGPHSISAWRKAHRGMRTRRDDISSRTSKETRKKARSLQTDDIKVDRHQLNNLLLIET